MLSELYSKIRLFTLWGKKPYFLLYKILGFIPENIDIYREALSHGSAKITDKKGYKLNNERLEFLGDAILDSIVSDMLYRQYPNEREGFLTNMRSAIVQRKSLNYIARKMNLTAILSIAEDINMVHNHIGGNALEALVGAVYVDKGYNACYKFVKEKIISPHINFERLANTEENYKSRLMEWGQKHRVDIDYILLENNSENNSSNNFKFELFIEGIACARGRGYSKKEAQQDAARKAYKLILNDEDFRKRIFNAQNYVKLAENRVTSPPNTDFISNNDDNNRENKTIKD